MTNAKDHDDNLSTAQNFIVSNMVFAVLVTLVFVPVLVKSLSGNRKVYIIAQQACVLIDFGLAIVISVTKTKTDTLNQIVRRHESNVFKLKEVMLMLSDIFAKSEAEKDSMRQKTDDLINSSGGLTIQQLILLESFLVTVKSVFQNMYYFYSFMQSYDVYVMVCKPFDYAHFSESSAIMKYMLWGSAFCFLFACDSLVNLAIEIVFTVEGTDLKGYTYRGLPVGGLHYDYDSLRVLFCLRIVGFVKLIILKLAYSVAVVRLACLTRKSLLESLQISKLNRKLHQTLFYFTLIPLFLSVMFSVHEVMILFNRLNWVLLGDHIVIGVQSTVVAFGSLFHFFGYIIISPTIRKNIVCQSLNK